jgi:hypothetical protein
MTDQRTETAKPGNISSQGSQGILVEHVICGAVVLLKILTY